LHQQKFNQLKTSIFGRMNINWILLIVGGLFETGFAISLGKAQHTSGKELWFWLAAFAVCVSISMFLLFKAMGGERAIPVGTAYAVWGAIGAVGTVVAGILLFKEPVTFWRIFFLSTLIISVIGLQAVSSHA
jgi:quaternary ammonium compound-resistance protein SugE